MEWVIPSRIERAVLNAEVLGVQERRVISLVQVDDRVLRYDATFGHSGEAASCIASACSLVATPIVIAAAAGHSDKREQRSRRDKCDSEIIHVNLLDRLCTDYSWNERCF